MLEACNGSSVNLHRSLWAVPVSRHRVPDELVRSLRIIIPALARQGPNAKKSNRGGWHSSSSALLDAVTSPSAPAAARSLRSTLLTAAGDYLRHQAQQVSDSAAAQLEGEIKLELLGAWANINGPGHSNVAHGHPGLLSGALYVEPGTLAGATLCLVDPRPSVAASANFQASWNRSCRSPLEAADASAGVALEDLLPGHLVLFPSWLQHAVPPHTSENRRVSISFNVRAELMQPKGPLRLTPDVTSLLPFGKPRMMEMIEYFGNDALHAVDIDANGQLNLLVSAMGDEPGMSTASRSRPTQALAFAFRDSGAVERWRCLAKVLAPNLAMRPSGSAALLTLPEGFVQSTREHRPQLAASGGTIGFHVLEGRLRLWLFDPRFLVEAVSAGDLIARRLFGRKVALELAPGDVAAFPAWLPSALEAVSGPTRAVTFTLQ